MIKAGDYRHRITIQEPVKTKDEFGQPIDTWKDVATVWAAIEPLRGREYFSAQQIDADITTRIRIRYRAGITSVMRALFGTRVFEFVSPPIDPEERHRELQLMCREVIG